MKNSNLLINYKANNQTRYEHIQIDIYKKNRMGMSCFFQKCSFEHIF